MRKRRRAITCQVAGCTLVVLVLKDADTALLHFSERIHSSDALSEAHGLRAVAIPRDAHQTWARGYPRGIQRLVWGFGRVLRIEIAALKARSVAVTSSSDVKAHLLDAKEDEMRVIDDACSVRRIRPIMRVTGALPGRRASRTRTAGTCRACI